MTSERAAVAAAEIAARLAPDPWRQDTPKVVERAALDLILSGWLPGRAEDLLEAMVDTMRAEYGD